MRESDASRSGSVTFTLGDNSHTITFIQEAIDFSFSFTTLSPYFEDGIMSGNVWEMCSDGYDSDSDYYRYSPLCNPQGIENESQRSGRGGSRNESASVCRNTYRNWLNPETLANHLGFRLARRLE